MAGLGAAGGAGGLGGVGVGVVVMVRGRGGLDHVVEMLMDVAGVLGENGGDRPPQKEDPDQQEYETAPGSHHFDFHSK